MNNKNKKEDKMEKLKILRKERKLSLKELGKDLGLAESTISLYETGKRQPDYATLLNIANYFNVSVDYLLNRVEDCKKEKAPTDLTDGELKLILSLRVMSQEKREMVMSMFNAVLNAQTND